jgi:hypothetical protein
MLRVVLLNVRLYQGIDSALPSTASRVEGFGESATTAFSSLLVTNSLVTN